MTRLSHLLLPLLSLLAATPAVGASKPPDAARYARDVVQLFATACLQHYPDPDGFARWVAGNGLEPLPAATAHKLTRDAQGRGYTVDLDRTHVILAVRHDDLCSVYVRRMDPSAVPAALAPLRAGLTESGQLSERRTVHRRHSEAGDLRTVDYAYTRADGQVMLHLTVVTSTSTQGFYQLALSASMATRRAPGDAGTPAAAASAGH